MNLNDKEIIIKLKNGDESILRELYLRNLNSVINYIKMNGGSLDEAKDIFQDSIILLLEKVKLDRFELTSSIDTYLIGICKMKWLKKYSKKRILVSVDSLYDFSDTEENQLQEIKDSLNAQIEILNKHFVFLGEICKKVLNYFYWLRLSTAEIAEKMGWANEDVVKTRKYKCIKELEKSIKTKIQKL